MKIYFAGSIRGGRNDKEVYLEIIKHLRKYGEVLSEHIGDPNLTEFGEENISDERIYERDLSFIKEADVIVVDVSTPSLGVGYEIAKAEELNKKVICLYRNQKGKRLSAMIAGNHNLRIKEYENLEEAIGLIDDFFRK